MPGRPLVTVITLLVACTWALVLMIGGVEVGWAHAKPLSMCIGVVSLALAGFDRWLWRLPGIRRLAGRPLLEGTYWGEVRTESIDPETKRKRDPIAAALVIRQSYSGIVVSLFTAESRSATLTASLDEDASGSFGISGLYRAEPRISVQHRSRTHHGALRLTVAGGDTRLSGGYWTDRESQGELEFQRVATRRAADFDEATALAGEPNRVE